MAGVPDLRAHVRDEVAAPEAVVVVRGGPSSQQKIAAHAVRTARAFVLDGSPVPGISVFAAVDDLGPASLSGILAGKLSTYRTVHLTTIGAVQRAGFTLLPTFTRPHLTVLPVTHDRVPMLLELLGPGEANPHYGETRGRLPRPRR